jgi:hypothetical protein
MSLFSIYMHTLSLIWLSNSPTLLRQSLWSNTILQQIWLGGSLVRATNILKSCKMVEENTRWVKKNWGRAETRGARTTLSLLGDGRTPKLTKITPMKYHIMNYDKKAYALRFKSPVSKIDWILTLIGQEATFDSKVFLFKSGRSFRLSPKTSLKIYCLQY